MPKKKQIVNTRRYQFEVATTDDEYNWVLTAPNGKPVATNVEPFKRKNDLTRTLAVLKRVFNDAPVMEVMANSRL